MLVDIVVFAGLWLSLALAVLVECMVAPVREE